MSTQKLGIKVPPFDRDDYNNWKKKMILFIRVDNLMYIEILENGMFIPIKIIPETIKMEFKFFEGLLQRNRVSSLTRMRNILRLTTNCNS